MTEHIREIASAPETAETEEKKNGITEGKEKGCSFPSALFQELEGIRNRQDKRFLNGNTLTGIFRFIYTAIRSTLSAPPSFSMRKASFSGRRTRTADSDPRRLIASYTLL